MSEFKEVRHEKCKRCKCWRLPTDFLNAKGRKLKTCKKCRDVAKKHREDNKEYYEKYRDENKDKNKKYRDENKEKIKEYRKTYRINNKEKIAVREKEYRQRRKPRHLPN